MLAFLCRFLGHRWRYGTWQKATIYRVRAGWKWERARTCQRCRESETAGSYCETKPLDAVHLTKE